MRWYGPWDEAADVRSRVRSRNHNVFDYVEQSMWRTGQNLDNLGTLMGLSRADKNKIEYSISRLPIVGSAISARDSWNYMNDYMRNTGTSWSDMPYPSMVRGAGSIGAAIGGWNFVSDNVSRLYELEDMRTARTTKRLVRQQTRPKTYRW